MLELGRAEEALAQVRLARSLLSSGEEVENGEALIRLWLVRALAATGDRHAAVEVLDEAMGWLRSCVDRISGESFRLGFLEQVPENEKLLALGAEWGRAPQAEPSLFARREIARHIARSIRASR